jgi:WD40 repeat protein
VADVAFTPEGRYLATANGDGTVSLLRVPGVPAAYRPAPPAPVPDPEKLAEGAAPADALRRQDVPAELLKKAAGGKPDALPQLVAVLSADGPLASVSALAVSPDGRFLATGGGNRAVRVWELATGRLKYRLTAPAGRGVTAVAFAPDSEWLASASEDARTVTLWHVGAGFPLGKVDCPGDVCHLAFSPDGKYLATCSRQSGVSCVEWRRQRELTQLKAGNAPATGSAFSPDGKYLAVALERSVRVWEVDTGWDVASFPLGSAYRVAFDPGGRYLAACAIFTRGAVWDLTTGKELPGTDAHSSGETSVTWRGDGRLLVTTGGGVDGPLRFWDPVAAGGRNRELRIFPDGSDRFVQAALTPDGRHLVTANPDGTLYVLRLAERGVVFGVPAEPGK